MDRARGPMSWLAVEVKEAVTCRARAAILASPRPVRRLREGEKPTPLSPMGNRIEL